MRRSRTAGCVDFITPGKPAENAYIENFNGKFRDDCLNEHRCIAFLPLRLSGRKPDHRGLPEAGAEPWRSPPQAASRSRTATEWTKAPWPNGNAVHTAFTIDYSRA